MAETHQFDAARMFSTKGFVAVVTGGATGIGLMTAQALAANGAKVYITGRRVEALETAAKEHSPAGAKESGGAIVPAGPCDVTKKDDLEKLVKEIGEKEKHIDLLVCNAGVSGTKAEPDDTDAKDLQKKLWEKESFDAWSQTYTADVSSIYFTTVAFLPLLQASMEHGGGTQERFHASVIVTSSMSGIMRHAQGHFSYNAAKAGAVHLTKLMSAEFQKLGVRVNSIAPGYFPSEMTAKESDEKNKSEVPPEDIQDKGHVPLERAGREVEMGMGMLFLAKCGYINGQIVTLDGGVLNVVGGN